MLFASADGDRGYVLVLILMIFGAVRIFNGAKKAATAALLKDEKKPGPVLLDGFPSCSSNQRGFVRSPMARKGPC